MISSCYLCRLRATRYKVVNGAGPTPCNIMFIGQSPNEYDDLKGEPFRGKSGKIIDTVLRRLNIDRSEVYMTYTVKCRVPGNRKPTQEEKLLCRVHLDKEIAMVEPKTIVLFGKTATETFLPMILGSFTPYVNQLHRIKFPHGVTDAIIAFDPMYINYNPSKMFEFIKTLRMAFTEYINME